MATVKQRRDGGFKIQMTVPVRLSCGHEGWTDIDNLKPPEGRGRQIVTGAQVPCSMCGTAKQLVWIGG